MWHGSRGVSKLRDARRSGFRLLLVNIQGPTADALRYIKVVSTHTQHNESTNVPPYVSPPEILSTFNFSTPQMKNVGQTTIGN